MIIINNISSCCAACTDILDPLSPLLPIVHGLIAAVCMFELSSCFCSAICGGP